MSSSDREGLLDPNWKQNATYLWGIPLHPLGEISDVDFLMTLRDDLETMRRTFSSQSVQNVILSVLLYITFRNFLVALKIIYRRPSHFSGWCCFLQALTGVAYYIFCLVTALCDRIACRQVIWTTVVCIVVSMACVCAVLLHKAYLVYNRRRWVLVVGALTICPQPYLCYIVWTSPSFETTEYGCILFYPVYAPLVKLAVDAPINVVLSALFLAVVYRQYRQFGSGAWKRLMRDGIQTMCLILLTNIACMLAVAFEVVGLVSDMFFVIDW